MQAGCFRGQGGGAQQPSAAMIRISTGIRNINARAVVNCLLPNHLPRSLSSSTSADYTSSAIALRERSDNYSSFTDRHRRNPALDVSGGGGPRPRTPRQWRTKTKRGSIARSEKLLDVVNRLSNSKEEVYGTLDAWIAWDLEFPLIAVKKALKTLKDAEEWRRIIQVSKWMLDKGQGRTLNTYQLLLEAFDHEGRIEEAEVLWEKVLSVNLECIPRAMFAQVIGMYDRYGKYKALLKVFADMEELLVKPDPVTLGRVVRAYTHFGYQEYAQTLLGKYPPSDVEIRYINGKRVKVRRRFEEHKIDRVPVEQGPGLQTSMNESKETLRLETSHNLEGTTPEISSGVEERLTSKTGIQAEERPTSEISNDLEEKLMSKTSNELEERRTLETRPTSDISNDLEDRLTLKTSNELEERLTLETNDALKEGPRFETNTELKERPRFKTPILKEKVI